MLWVPSDVVKGVTFVVGVVGRAVVVTIIGDVVDDAEVFEWGTAPVFSKLYD